jgi:hypothetical protein
VAGQESGVRAQVNGAGSIVVLYNVVVFRLSLPLCSMYVQYLGHVDRVRTGMLSYICQEFQ